MNGSDKLGAEKEQLDLINAQPTGLKPPGAMKDQIEISADFGASLDELFHGRFGLQSAVSHEQSSV